MIRYGNLVYSRSCYKMPFFILNMATRALQESVKEVVNNSRFIKYTVYNVKGRPTKCKSNYIVCIHQNENGETLIRFGDSYIRGQYISLIDFPAKYVRFKNHEVICDYTSRFLDHWRKLYDN